MNLSQGAAKLNGGLRPPLPNNQFTRARDSVIGCRLCLWMTARQRELSDLIQVAPLRLTISPWGDTQRGSTNTHDIEIAFRNRSPSRTQIVSGSERRSAASNSLTIVASRFMLLS